MTATAAKKKPETPQQVAARLYAQHGPMPDHLLQKTARVLRDAQTKAQAETQKPA